MYIPKDLKENENDPTFYTLEFQSYSSLIDK